MTLSPHYAIIIDSGSSGSRALVYSFTIDSNNNPNGLPLITQIYNKKTKPGLSTFGHKKPGKYDLWDDHFDDIIDDAKKVIPVNLHSSTPIFVQATAGMRLLPTKDRERILKETCKVLSKESDFIVEPCDEHVQVIDGDTEGLYGWLALNYLTNNLQKDANRHPYGFMDMGGASTQLAFVPIKQDQLDKHSDDMYNVKLRTNDGSINNFSVFVSSWLGFGANEARRRQLDALVNALPPNINYDKDGDGKGDLVDPCSPVGMKTEVEYNGKVYTVTGSGEYEGCLKTIYPLLLKHMPCSDEPCLFNGVHAPSIDFSMEKFVGVSEYWYTANDVFKLEGDYNYEDFEEATKNFCKSDWNEIYEKFENHEYKDALTLELLKTSCFKASWIVNILHEGFGIPRLGIDNEDLLIKDEPVFKSVQNIDGNELSWTLGKMVMYSSSQIPGDSTVGIYPGSAIGKSFNHNNEINNNSGLLQDIDSTYTTTKSFLTLTIFLMAICIGYYSIIKKFGSLNKFLRKVKRHFQMRSECSIEMINMEEGRSLSHQKSNEDIQRTLRTRSTMNLHELHNSNSPDLNESHSAFGSPIIPAYDGLKHSFTFTSFRDPQSSKLGKFTPFKLGNGSQQSIKSSTS
jgi:Golgi apyrase